ncbi:MAG: hypothetical protein WC890_00030 [Candidatus Margulisiibacteriota bacterium]
MKELVVLFLVLFISSISYAGEYSLRSLGMGDVFDPFTGGTSQVFYNPVVSGNQRGQGVLAIANPMQNVGYPYNTLSVNIDCFKNSFNKKSNLMPNIILFGSEINNYYQIGAAANWDCIYQSRLGLGCKYFNQKGYFDVGWIWYPRRNNVALSLSALNIGDNNSSMPQTYCFNAAYQFNDFNIYDIGTNDRFVLSKMIFKGKLSSNIISPHVGIDGYLLIKEVLFPRLLICRAGWNNDHPTIGISAPIPVARYAAPTLDIAWDIQPNNNHVLFGVSI